MVTSPERKKEAQAATRARLNAYKLERGCADCGYNAHPAALHLDHRPGTVKDPGGQGRATRPQWSWERIEAQLALCDVVCANCHAVRTAERGYGRGRPRR